MSFDNHKFSRHFELDWFARLKTANSSSSYHLLVGRANSTFNRVASLFRALHNERTCTVVKVPLME